MVRVLCPFSFFYDVKISNVSLIIGFGSLASNNFQFAKRNNDKNVQLSGLCQRAKGITHHHRERAISIFKDLICY